MTNTTAWVTLQANAMQFLASLPTVAAGIVVFVVFWYAGKLTGRLTCRLVIKALGEADLGRALAHLVRFGIVVLGVLIAAVVIFPSVRPADVLAFLGLGSVAIGFAFKDIFQNFLSGILILFRRPFRLGDQVRSGEIEGTVEDINLRATVIKTYAGERVIIPNTEVYTRPVMVRTAYGCRRSSFVVGIGYPDDVERAKALLTARLQAVDGVLPEPRVWVRTVELAPSAVNLEIFYWTSAYQHAVLAVGDRVATTTKLALDEAGIDMPFPVRRLIWSAPLALQTPEVERRHTGDPTGLE